jgi:putative membrane protein
VARLMLIASWLLCSATLAQAGSHAHHHGRQRASLADWQFMRRAAATGEAVIAAGAVAQKQAAQHDVRELATTLVRQDKVIEGRLSLLSLYTQVPLPGKPTGEDAKAIAALHPLAGEAFDRRWLQEEAVLQERLVLLFQKEAASGAADPALRSFAREFLSKLQAGLQATGKLQAGLSAAAL